MKGRVVSVSEVTTGRTNTGKEWQKCTLVVKSDEGEYSKDFPFTAFNDRVGQIDDLREGQEVEVSFNINPREYNGKWYTDLSFFGVKVESETVANEVDEEKADTLDPQEADLPF